MRRLALLLLAASMAFAGVPRRSYGLDLPAATMVRGTPEQWEIWRDSWDTKAKEILTEFFQEQDLWESAAKASHIKIDSTEERGRAYQIWSQIREENAKLGGYPCAEWHLLVWLESAWVERHEHLGGSPTTPEYKIWRAHVIQTILTLDAKIEAARTISDQYLLDRPEMEKEFMAMRQAREDMAQAQHLQQHQAAMAAETSKREPGKDPTNGLASRMVKAEEQEMDLWTQMYRQEKQKQEEGQ